MKIKTKVLLLFIVVSMIPILIISAFMYQRYRQVIFDQMNQQSGNVFDKAAKECEDKLENINTITGMITLYSDSDNSIITDLQKYNDKNTYSQYDVFKSNNNIKFICQSLLYTSDYINGIFIFTPCGEVLGYGYGGNIDVIASYAPFKDEWYKETLQKNGKIYVSPLEEKDFLLNSKQSVSFSKALYDVINKEYLGVLLIDCSPDIFDLSSINTMPDTTILTISREQGDILYSNASDFKESFSDSQTKTLTRFLELGNITLTSSTNYEVLYKEFANTLTLLIVLAILLIIVVIIVSSFVTYYITKPITSLTSRIARSGVNQASFDNKYGNRSDEIGILYNEYQNMILELQDYVQKEYKNKLIVMDSQMRAFEAQINSHFLYNTLESINSVAEIAEVESICTMSMALGNMFRYSIKTQSELVTLQDELNHVNDYISIQMIRFSNKFSLTLDVPDELRPVRVLKLILQPLIENALYHGLQNCTSGNLITIVVKAQSSSLIITITDNGQGMSESVLNNLNDLLNEPAKFQELGQRKKESIGIKNVHSRIQLYYGETYGIKVESQENEGTTVTIIVPQF